MVEARYKNREIDTFMEVIKKDLAEFRKDVETRDIVQRGEIQSGFGAITARQDTQNGRISKMEKWQYSIMGGLSVITVIVIPILAWALFILVNINTQVHLAVDQALSAYNIQK